MVRVPGKAYRSRPNSVRSLVFAFDVEPFPTCWAPGMPVFRANLLSAAYGMILSNEFGKLTSSMKGMKS